MEASAARMVARSGCAPDTFVLSAAASRLTASAVVMTPTVTLFVSNNVPSLTTSRIVCVPTGRTGTATTPQASGLPFSNQLYWSASPSRSDEREPSSITLALVASGEMTSGIVALASADGRKSTNKVATELVATPNALLTVAQ